jgi:hypothetical protein
MHDLKDGFQLKLESKIDTIWAIVAFSRPNTLPSIIKNFQNQTFPGKKLAIVENGKGIGTCKAHGFEPDLLLTSDTHQSYAKNEAIHYLKKHGGGIWTTWDDDDYYGPRYLEEIAHNFDSEINILGKTQIFILNSQSKLWLAADYEEYASVTMVYGPTITGRIEEACDFHNCEWGEDNEWMADMIAAGAKARTTSKYHFLYNRSQPPEEHTFPITDYQILQCMPEGVLEFDKLDYEIINGAPFTGTATYIKRGPRKVTDSPAYHRLIKLHGPSKLPDWFNSP